VDGPLLLVAGGRIRVSGAVSAGRVWKLGEGGGTILPHGATPAPLELDEPLDNLLVEPVRLAVMSAPVRPSRGVVQWRPAIVDGSRGEGAFRVRFLGERESGPRQVEVFGPVDDVVLLEGCQAVRVLIELDVLPGDVWDPPRVDSVQLAWNEPLEGRREGAR